MRKLAPEGKAPILCFVGPPGVGKTSLGQSIARAMGRKFVRVSLGGVHDEAEIRGHRRTYVGALPGNIIQGIRRPAHATAVMMLDEIDKLGARHPGRPVGGDARGAGPGAERDLPRQLPRGAVRPVAASSSSPPPTCSTPSPGRSATAWRSSRLSGYTDGEKLEIAKRYLMRRQLEANGLKPEQAEISDAALREIIDHYTRESGVRNLEREIGRALRHAAVEIAEGKAESVRIDDEGPPRHARAAALRERGGDADERPRRRDRPRLDAGRRRHPVRRGDPRSRLAAG